MSFYSAVLLAMGILPLGLGEEFGFPESNKVFDRIVEETMEETDAPGIFVAILHNGKPVYQRATGIADLESGSKLTPQSPSRLASATKVLSSLAILSLAEDDVIDLDDRVCAIDPDMPAQWCDIPLWRLMNHTSGIPLILAQSDFHAVPDLKKLHLSSAELLGFILNRELDFQPGENWHYQQSGLVLFANLIEKATGKSWNTIVKEHVLEVAGMTETRWTHPLTDQAPAYDRKEGVLVTTPAYYPIHMSQGGGYDSNGADLMDLLAAVANESIVSKAFLEKQILQEGRLYRLGRDTDQEGYGLASIVQIFGKTKTYGHTGGGGLAEIRFALDPAIGVVVLTNRAGGTAAANKISSRLFEEILGPQARIPIED